MALCLLNLFMFMYTVLYTTLYTVHIYIPGERQGSVSSQPLLVYVHCTLLFTVLRPVQCTQYCKISSTQYNRLYTEQSM